MSFQYNITVIGAGDDRESALEYCSNFNIAEFEKPAGTLMRENATFSKELKIRVQNKHLQIKDIPLLKTKIVLTCYGGNNEDSKDISPDTDLAIVYTKRTPGKDVQNDWIKKLQEKKIETIGVFSYENIPEDLDVEENIDEKSGIDWYDDYVGSLDFIYCKLTEYLGGEPQIFYKSIISY